MDAAALENQRGPKTRERPTHNMILCKRRTLTSASVSNEVAVAKPAGARRLTTRNASARLTTSQCSLPYDETFSTLGLSFDEKMFGGQLEHLLQQRYDFFGTARRVTGLQASTCGRLAAAPDSRLCARTLSQQLKTGE